MLTILDKQLTAQMPVDYVAYLDWLDEICPNKFFRVATTNVNIRKRDDWNILGREIYDKSLLMEHCEKLIKIISKLCISDFVLGHEYKQFKWLPDIHNDVDTNKYNEVKEYLQNSLKLCNVEGIDTKLFLSQSFAEFLPIFIDYPFLLKYRNIDVISVDINLIIQITHHLSVDFISSDRMLMQEIVSLCDSVGLMFEKSSNLI